MEKMKYLFLMFLSSCLGFKKVKEKPKNVELKMKESIYSFKMEPLYGGESIELSAYKGKKILIVNTASECGYTPQYKPLQELNEKYSEKVVVLGFPANDFGAQEPGNNERIGEFCKLNYGVTFQMFEKISVKGDAMHPLYQWLSQKDKNGWNEESPNWNFCKYLIDEKGELLKFYGSAVDPLGDEILNAIGER